MSQRDVACGEGRRAHRKISGAEEQSLPPGESQPEAYRRMCRRTGRSLHWAATWHGSRLRSGWPKSVWPPFDKFYRNLTTFSADGARLIVWKSRFSEQRAFRAGTQASSSGRTSKMSRRSTCSINPPGRYDHENSNVEGADTPGSTAHTAAVSQPGFRRRRAASGNWTTRFGFAEPVGLATQFVAETGVIIGNVTGLDDRGSR